MLVMKMNLFKYCLGWNFPVNKVFKNVNTNDLASEYLEPRIISEAIPYSQWRMFIIYDDPSAVGEGSRVASHVCLADLCLGV